MQSDLEINFVTLFILIFLTIQFTRNARKPNINIIGITTDVHAYRKLALSWGVLPAMAEEYTSIDILFYFAKQIAKQSGLLKKGDTIVITAGTPNGKSGNSNLINVDTI